MRAYFYPTNDSSEASTKFNAWLQNVILQQKWNGLKWKEATGALVCHPCEEHLLPLLMIVGSSSSDDTGKEYIDTAVRPS